MADRPFFFSFFFWSSFLTPILSLSFFPSENHTFNNQSLEPSQPLLSHYHIVFQILPPKCLKYTPSSSFSLPVTLTTRSYFTLTACYLISLTLVLCACSATQSCPTLALLQSTVRMILQDKVQSPCRRTDPFSPGSCSLPSTLSKDNPFQENSYLLRRVGSGMALWLCTFCCPLTGHFSSTCLSSLFVHPEDSSKPEKFSLRVFFFPCLSQLPGGHLPTSRLLFIILITLY